MKKKKLYIQLSLKLLSLCANEAFNSSIQNLEITVQAITLGS